MILSPARRTESEHKDVGRERNVADTARMQLAYAFNSIAILHASISIAITFNPSKFRTTACFRTKIDAGYASATPGSNALTSRCLSPSSETSLAFLIGTYDECPRSSIATHCPSPFTELVLRNEGLGSFAMGASRLREAAARERCSISGCRSSRGEPMRWGETPNIAPGVNVALRSGLNGLLGITNE